MLKAESEEHREDYGFMVEEIYAGRSYNVIISIFITGATVIPAMALAPTQWDEQVLERLLATEPFFGANSNTVRPAAQTASS